MRRFICMCLMLLFLLSTTITFSCAEGSGSTGVTITVEATDPGGSENNPGEEDEDVPSTPGGSGGSGGGADPNKPIDTKPSGEPSGGYDKDGDAYTLVAGISVNPIVQEYGYMIGKPGYVFDMNGLLTRAEFATIVDRVFKFNPTAQSKSFLDIRGHWAEKSILNLAKHGVIFGVSSTEFRPDDILLRDQVFLMLGRILYTKPYSSVTDVIDLDGHYAESALSRMLNVGLHDELPDNYDIEAPITRGEMCHLINNIIYRRNAFNRSIEQLCNSKGIYVDLLKMKGSLYYSSCIQSLDMLYIKEGD